MNLRDLCKRNKYTSSKEYWNFDDYQQSVINLFDCGELKMSKTPIDMLIRSEQLSRNLDSTPAIEIYDEVYIRSLTDNFPVFYIDSDFCDLITMTDYPVSVPLDKMFVPDAIFLFPKHNKMKIKSCTVSSTYYDLLRTWGKDPNGCDFFLKNNSKDDVNYVFSAMFDAENSARNVGRWGTDIREKWEANRQGKYISDKYVRINVKNGMRSQIGYVENLNSFIAQIFLYMATYPDDKITMRQSATKDCGVGFGEGNKKPKYTSKLTPRMIGGECDRYVYEQKRSQTTGTGKSKATHWRRGHWRHQNKIVNQVKTKELIWIKPILVNPQALNS